MGNYEPKGLGTMNSVKIVLPALAALMLAGSAFAADSPPPPPRGPIGCHAAMGALTAEERIIQFQDVKKNMDAMTVAQFRDWRKAECDKVAKMTPDERKKYAESLNAKWKALPDSEKVKLYHEASQMRDGMGPRQDFRHHRGDCRDATACGGGYNRR